MRIGHFITDYSTVGGIQRYLARLIAAQVSAGDDARVLDSVEALRRASAESLDIVHAHALLKPNEVGVPVIRHLHGHWPYCPSGSRFLARWGRACDRAYSPTGCAWGHVVDHCGSVRPGGFVADFRRTRAERRMLSRVRTIAISEFVRSQMVRSGYDGSMIDVVYLPAPVDANVTPPPAEGPARFLFLGRLVPQKGCGWVIDAAAAAGGNFHLDIAGDGPERQRLERRAAGLGGRVRFHGWVEEARVRELLAAARAVVFPSIWPEPAGLVTIEAAAAGRAAIVSRTGGIPEYAEKCGHCIIVEPGDVAGLTAALRKLADDEELAGELGAAGAVAAGRQFSMSAHLVQLDSCYQRAIDGWGRPR